MDSEKGMTSGVKKFDGTEFEVWSVLMEGVLESRGIWYVIETPRDAVAESKSISKWDKDDRSARTTILLALEHDMVKAVMTSKTAAQMWKKLETIHSQRSESCKMVLWKEYYDTKMSPGAKVSEYVTKMEFLAMKLRNIGEELSDDSLISKIVSGLSSDYKHFMSNWLATSKSDRTFENLLPRLLAEESIAQEMDSKDVTAMKMATSASPHNKDKRARKNKKDIECYHCQKKGHYKRDCRLLKKEKDQGKKDQGKSQDKETVPSDKKYAVVAKAAHARASGQSWLIDSGASYHMTSKREWIINYKAYGNKIPILVGNSDYLYALGAGTIAATSIVDGEKISVELKNVQYVPGISDNLFSQGAADSNGISVVTKNGKIRLLAGEKTIMIGNRGESNLYWLNLQVEMRANVARAERTLEEWHKALGHPDINAIKNMEKLGCTEGFKIVANPSNHERCGECQQGKGHKVPHPESGRERSSEVLHRVHVDLVGAIDPPSLSGSKYFMLAKDEHSSYMHVFFMGSKSQVIHAMKKYIDTASVQTQRKVQIVRSDNGSEFKNTGFKLMCEAEGIVQEFSAPYTAPQNGEAERANRTVIETARTMLQASGLPLSLWAESVLTAVYLRNRIVNRQSGNRTPYEIFHGKPPSYSHLIEFGRELHVLDSSKGVSKFSSKTREVFMTGYTDRINTYRCYDPKTNDIIISSDLVIAPHETRRSETEKIPTFVTFTIERDVRSQEDAESSMATQAQLPRRSDATGVSPIDLPEISEESARQSCSMAPTFSSDNVTGAIIHNRPITDQQQADSRVVASEIPPPVPRHRQATERLTSQEERLVAPGIVNPSQIQPRQQANITPASVSQTTRALKVPAAPQKTSGANAQSRSVAVVPPGKAADATAPPGSIVQRLAPSIGDWILKDRPRRNVKSVFARNLSMKCVLEPSSYYEATNGEDAGKWIEAISDELNAHRENNTWVVVPKKANTKQISAKWVFKVKHNADGSVERYKARLVARGFTQQKGIDYTEVFSPVVRMDSIRLLFSICAQYGLKYAQFDITTAFLNGDVKEELYLEPPEGLELPEGHTCRLLRSLYGLKQAPRCWNAKFSEMLKTFNMTQTTSDPCVYVAEGDEQMFLALYVDDGLIFAENSSSIKRLLDYLTSWFKVKTVESQCFVGIEIVRNASDGSIFLHQSGYVKRMLEKFNMLEANGSATPLEVGHSLNRHETLACEPLDNVPYREAVGSLLYCAMGTRPDIAYALSVLSKYCREPRQQHWQAVKRVFRYLKETCNHGLIYRKVETPDLVCYSDADHAGDHINRRSTTGMITFLTTGPISYRAQQQSVVSLSTTEAEYIAASEAVKDLIWLQRFVEELKVPNLTRAKLLCDNESALKLIKNSEFHHRTKHIEIRFHFVREKYEKGEFELDHVRSKDQKADIFTKALAKDQYRCLRDSIGCVDPERVLNERGC